MSSQHGQGSLWDELERERKVTPSESCLFLKALGLEPNMESRMDMHGACLLHSVWCTCIHGCGKNAGFSLVTRIGTIAQDIGWTMVVLDMLRAKGPPMLIACGLLVMWNTQLYHPIESHPIYVYFCQSYLRVTKNAHDGIASSLDMCKYSMCACPHNRDFLDGKDEKSQSTTICHLA